jgi:hypothetical protein
MHFTDASGNSASIDMSMTTRGRSRLEYCRFPPLKVNLKRGQAEGTVFDGQNKLKIVTHCRGGDQHETYLQQEFGIYRAYNELTDLSFRARWISATFKDTDGKNEVETFPAFFIESIQEVAERHGMERVPLNRIKISSLDPVAANRGELFQFLIGNTDWSMLQGPDEEGCCHNGEALAAPGSTTGWVVIPYDFDQAGLIDTRYAKPAADLRIRKVTQRLYRGLCRFIDELDPTIAMFNERRPVLEPHLVPATISERDQKTAREFVDEFYEIVNDPKQKERRILADCRGKRT